MTTYAIRRILTMVPLLLAISFVIFAFMQLQPGDPIDELRLANPRITPLELENLRRAYGLDQPWYVRYGKWLGRAVTLDFGASRSYNVPAAAFVIRQKLGNTLLLSGAAFLLAIAVGLPVGILSAVRQYGALDYTITFLSFAGLSTPVFWLGTMLAVVFSLRLGWLPFGGTQSPDATMYEQSAQRFDASGEVKAVTARDGQTVITVATFDADSGLERSKVFVVPGGARAAVNEGDYVNDGDAVGERVTISSALGYAADRARYLVLPAITLSLIQMATWARFMRASLLEVINHDYVRTARGKGVAERVVIFKHAVRNALLPIVTLLGLSVPSLLGGAVLTETVFNWPGVGTALLASIVEKDSNVAMVILLALAAVTLVSNLLADLAYAVVDPRIRYS